MRRHPLLRRYTVLTIAWLAVCAVLAYANEADAVGLILRVACSAAAWAFVWRFGQVNWKATAEGRHIMGYTLITAIFMSLASLVTFFGRFPGIEFVTLVLYGWLLALLWERHRLFSDGQAERRNNAGENA